MPRRRRRFRAVFSLPALGATLLIISVIVPAGLASGANRPFQRADQHNDSRALDNIRKYISSGWDRLTRSLDDCNTYKDIKTEGPAILYLPADFAVPQSVAALQKRCGVHLAHLPHAITKLGPDNFDAKQPDGLLYLEHPYVVPGGQFNEMYGWDSYFIILGLLDESRIALAKGMVENFFFEIEHYGGILNANRTYYLTRSQPPFLTSMILAVNNAEEKSGRSDTAWLNRAYDFAVKDHDYWNEAPHRAGDTGLSRYFDFGVGPVPEILGDPSHYYRGAAQFFVIHEGARGPHVAGLDDRNHSAVPIGPVFSAFVCDSRVISAESNRCADPDQITLTSDYYTGDRSMRESGFDVSFRFGAFSGDTHHYAPDCLNSLLYKEETDLSQIAAAIGRSDEAERWTKEAAARKQQILKYLWNSDRGLFFDYDFTTRSQSSYEYATTFYPLWAGLASQEQARAVSQNLKLFEQPGGIAMSRRDTKAQWDYPYGWAPMHLLSVEGLRRYGDEEDADRISYKFLLTVLENFEKDGTIREKYDVVARSSETHIGAGYRQNVIGFGWTNGVFLELLNQLPSNLKSQLEREGRISMDGKEDHDNHSAR